MKRIITLGLTLLIVASLAWTEKNEPFDPNVKAYRLNISTYKLMIVTPLDSQRSVLIGVKKPFQKEPDAYLAEGYLALALSRAAKLVGKEDHSPPIKKYVKEMVEARALAAKVGVEEGW